MRINKNSDKGWFSLHKTLFLAEHGSAQELAEKISSIEKKDRIVLVLDEAEQQALAEKGIEFKNPLDYLGAKDLKQIYEKAVFLTKNWHSFDREISKMLEYRGINLAVLQDLEFEAAVGRKMLCIKAVKKCIAAEKPKKIIAASDSLAKKIELGIKKELVECGKAPAEKRLFNYKRYWELREKASRLFSGAFKKKSGRKNIFVRSRNFLEKIKTNLQNESEFNVISLDELLLKKSLNPLEAAKSASHKGKLFHVWKKLSKNREFLRQMAFEGANLAELMPDFFERIFEKEFAEHMHAIDVLYPEFEKEKPSAIVLWEDWTAFERAAVIIAAKKNIPSIVVQHGIVFDLDYGAKNWMRGFAPLTADFFVAWGKNTKKLMEAKGIEGKRIFVAGASRFDSLAGNRFSKKETREKLGIPEGKKLIVLATEAVSFENNSYKMAENICKAAGKIENCVLAIKPHPTEYRQKYKEIAGEYRNAIVRQDIPVQELLNAADLAIVFRSTVGLEAMLLEKPVLVYNVNCKGVNPFLEMEKSAVISSEAEIEGKIRKALLDKKEILKTNRAFASDYLFLHDGNSTARVIEIVKKIAGLKKTVLAVIPARAASKRLPNKNILELCGKPLIAYSIEEALKSGSFDEVIVSTDSGKIGEIARKFGASVPFIRPKSLAEDNSSSFDVLRHAVEKFEKKAGRHIDCAAVLQPTSPLRSAEQISSAAKMFFGKKANSLFSVSRLSRESKFPVFLEKSRLKFAKARKNKKGLFSLNGAIFIHDRKTLFAGGAYPIGKKCVLFEMPIEDSIDIDTKEDFEKAEKAMKKRLSK